MFSYICLLLVLERDELSEVFLSYYSGLRKVENWQTCSESCSRSRWDLEVETLSLRYHDIPVEISLSQKILVVAINALFFTGFFCPFQLISSTRFTPKNDVHLLDC